MRGYGAIVLVILGELAVAAGIGMYDLAAGIVALGGFAVFDGAVWVVAELVAAWLEGKEAG